MTRQVGQLSLSASPESVNLLMGLPDAVVAMLLLGLSSGLGLLRVCAAVAHVAGWCFDCRVVL